MVHNHNARHSIEVSGCEVVRFQEDQTREEGQTGARGGVGLSLRQDGTVHTTFNSAPSDGLISQLQHMDGTVRRLCCTQAVTIANHTRLLGSCRIHTCRFDNSAVFGITNKGPAVWASRSPLLPQAGVEPFRVSRASPPKSAGALVTAEEGGSCR